MGTFLFLVILTIFAVPVICGACLGKFRLAKTRGIKDARLIGRSLFWALPYFLALPFFWIGDLGDPLWPNQDLSDSQMIAYQRQHSHSMIFYGVGIVIMIGAFFWQAGRTVRHFLVCKRPAKANQILDTGAWQPVEKLHHTET